MEIGIKDVVAFGSLLVSAAAFFYSTEANQKAQELDELAFRAETVSQLLKEVHENTSSAIAPEDRTASCLYAGSLAKAEALFVKDENNHLVGKLFLDQVERGLLPQNCVVETLEALPEESVATAIDAAVSVEKADSTDVEIGTYHALIASYPTTVSGCDAAKDDVEEFKELLIGHGLDGERLYIARTVKSNSYAVTVDAGSDRAKATLIRDEIKNVSDNAFGKTGSDSFVQQNTDWYIDASCAASAFIGG